MNDNIKYYKKLFSEKKFQEIIDSIDKNEKNKTAKIYHIRGICKFFISENNKKIRLSSREDFRKAFLLEKNTELGVEALTNFININTDFLEVNDSIGYFNQLDENFKNDKNILKSISRVYQFSARVEDRIKILEKIIKFYPSSIDDWCSYIYINNFINNWDQKNYYENTSKFSKNLVNYSMGSLILDNNIINRKVKIGFLSSDLNLGHSITYFLRGLIKNLSKNKYEIYIISNSEKDEKNNELKNLVTDWFNIKKLKDKDAISFIREKKIDIIFDLMGFTSDNRITILKNKIAPIQVSWLGYCNTLGLKEIDYIFADNNLIFQNEEKYYSEKVKRFDNIWNAHEGFNFKRNKTEPPLIKNEYITFGSFNNFNKISNSNLKTWAELLKRIKKSKLLLKSSISYNLEYFKNHIKELGVSNKVEFIERPSSFDEHLKYYEKIDLALDTFPYNGVTTTFEALWKGVPVLTLEGNNFNSRCGSSIIKNLGLIELVSNSQEEYLSKAIQLASNKEYLIGIRNKIFNRLMETPIFDINKFSKNFDKLIENIISEKLS